MNEGFEVATAVKNNGGIVIVQVEYLAKKDTLNPKDVKIPGKLVDYVVQAKDPKSCWQVEGTYWEAVLFRTDQDSVRQHPASSIR
ncbi:MAG: hypothetical protein V8S58_09990 [Lachnospiraceae bacterium]